MTPADSIALEREITKALTKEARRLVAEGQRCAWPGCRQTYRGPMPKGWNVMLLFWPDLSLDPLQATWIEIGASPHCLREAPLCREHSGFFQERLPGLPGGKPLDAA
jgi:hypothetical protein